ncbi:MAG: NAD(P)-binding protein, partial [Actinobacteria bacterium]|nr:NAD(P)-binding protein [Actinomycetota bacterium]
MPEATIVGAGLSGSVAAINLARRGFDVTILEKEKQVCGGMPEFRPDPAGSPLPVGLLKRWTGVDIGPAVKKIDEATFWGWGTPIKLDIDPDWSFQMVERGTRDTSIDTYLYKQCLAEGVKIECGRPIETQKDYADLPRDTIIATGLRIQGFEALNLPYAPLYGFFAKGKVDHDRTTVSLWMDTFSNDYAFNCTINGVSFAILFQRDVPLSKKGMDKYKRMLSEKEGIEFDNWHSMLGGACPVGSIRNPKLFHGKLILTGTLSGVIDPILFFGMMGALASGVIAADALEDREKAYNEFKAATRMFYPCYVVKKGMNMAPHLFKAMAIK